MSITQRLTIAFSILVAALVITGASAVVLLYNSQTRFEYVQNHTVGNIVNIDAEIRETNELRADLFRHLLTDDTAFHEQLEARIGQHIKAIELKLETLRRNDRNDQVNSDADRSNAAGLTAIKRSIPQFLASSNAGYTSEGSKSLSDSGQIGKTFNVLVMGLKSQVEVNTRTGEALRNENETAYLHAVWLMIICIGSVIVLGGFFTAKTILLVRSSLLNIETSLRKVSTTFDLTSRANVDREDEIGRTALAFNSLLATVANALGTVVDSVSLVSSAARQIASGNIDLSSRTEQQAASLQQTAASMNELTTTVAQNAANAQEGRKVAVAARQTADIGNQSVDAMISTMLEISSSSTKVSEITGLIEGIAFQTNILALNASVEAARAGSNGKGFAVVAAEVRSLAQRSAEAAKEIKGLISVSTALISTGSRLAAEAGGTMRRVTESIGQVASIMTEIAGASEEQQQGIEQVNQAVAHMDRVTQHNAALVDEATGATTSLERQAAALREAISVFKVQTT